MNEVVAVYGAVNAEHMVNVGLNHIKARNNDPSLACESYHNGKISIGRTFHGHGMSDRIQLMMRKCIGNVAIVCFPNHGNCMKHKIRIGRRRATRFDTAIARAVARAECSFLVTWQDNLLIGIARQSTVGIHVGTDHHGMCEQSIGFASDWDILDMMGMTQLKTMLPGEIMMVSRHIARSTYPSISLRLPYLDIDLGPSYIEPECTTDEGDDRSGACHIGQVYHSLTEGRLCLTA